MRKDRQRWAEEKAEAGERAWATGQLKDAFSNFRQLRSATKTVSTLIMNKAGILISDKKGKLQCWNEHFSLLLNRPSAFPSDELQQAAATPPENSDVSCASSSEDEVLAALEKLKNGKARASAILPSRCSRRVALPW